MPAPYSALTYGDPTNNPATVTTYNAILQSYPYWLGTTIFAPGTQYAAYSQSFIAGGSCPQTIKVQSGSLPNGLTLSDVGTVAGELYQISGVPTAAGTFTFTLRATNSSGFMDRQFSITIGSVTNAPPFWPSFSFANGTLAVAYTQQFTPNGSGTITTTLLSGSLPSGLSLSLVSGSTYQISGTPTATGTFSFTLRATNSYGTADQAFSVTVSSAGGGASYTFVA